MVINSLSKVYFKALKYDEVFVVGSSYGAKEVADYFEEKGRCITGIMQNNESNSIINGIKVIYPIRIQGSNAIYIITAGSEKSRHELYKSLTNNDISESQIAIYYPHHDWYYHKSLDRSEYKSEVMCLFKDKFGYDLDWDNPKSYNEIINKEKITYDDPLRTMLADKYKARYWVSNKIGEKYLTRQYGVYSAIEDVDFDSLPNEFVLKLNNASGRNIIVENKEKADFEEIKSTFNMWLKYNFAYYHLEMQYLNIEPKIICEEFLPGLAKTIYDYNIFCFNGEPKYIWCINGSHRPGCKASFYDLNWNIQPFYFGYPQDEVIAPRPSKLDEMLELSRVLCKDFKHVRVDWYNMPDGRILFGEMTFSTWGGVMKIIPEEYDCLWGSYIVAND